MYLNVADKCQDAAALVIAKWELHVRVSEDCAIFHYEKLHLRFVTRPDVKIHYLPEFLSWCLKDLPLIDGDYGMVDI